MHFARSLVLALALAGTASVVAGPDVAYAQDVLPAEGLIAFLPAGDVVGDGTTSTDVWLLALDSAGKPMKGLKLKTQVSDGDLGSLSSEGKGLYKLTLTPPAVDAETTVTISLRGKTPNKDSVDLEQAITVRPPVATELDVSVNPERVTLGTGTNGTITVQLSGNTEGADVIARTSAGALASVVGMGGGKFTASFTPDSVNFPHLAIVGVADRRHPAEAIGYSVVPMDGKTEFPVSSKPNASVMMKIGDKEFGPVQTDAAGKAKVPVIVPPGATTATLVTIEDGSTSESSIDLQIPETRRMLILPAQSGFVAAEGKSYPIRIAVATPDGKPDTGAKVTLTATTGKVTAAKHEGGGIYAANYTPGAADTRTIATISAQVGDSPTQVDSMDVTLIPDLPANVSLSTSPEFIGKGAVAVTASLTDGSGSGLTGKQVVVEATGGRVTEAASDAGEGLYKGKIDGGSADRVEVFATVKADPSGNALRHLVVLPGVEKLTNDGSSKTAVTVVASDAEGHPVAGVPVQLALTGSGGSLPSSVTTGPNGYARVTFTAGSGVGVAQIRATAGGRVGSAAILQAPAGVDAIDLPDAVSGEAKAIRDAWAARMPTVVLAKKGGTAVATAPKPAPEPAATEPAPAPKPEPAPEPKPEPAPAAPEPTEFVPTKPDREVAGEGATVSSVSIEATPAEVPAGGSTTLVISALDSSGKGVEGHSFELLTDDGKLGSVDEIGAGDYAVEFSVPKKASGEVRVSIASEDGPAAFKKLSVGEAVASAKPTKTPKTKTPREPREPSEEKWLRVRGGAAISSYWYEQDPTPENTALLPERFSVGASAGPNATSIGGEIDARAWFLPWLGVDARVRTTFHGVSASVFGGATAPDTLFLGEVHGLARYPFDAGASTFHVGARLGVDVSDYIFYTGSVESGTVEYSNFVVPALDLGAEIGAQVGDLGVLAGFTQGLAYFSVPSRTAIDFDVTYDIADPLYLHGGFGVQTRRLPVISAGTEVEQGTITDGQLMFTIGAGVAF